MLMCQNHHDTNVSSPLGYHLDAEVARTPRPSRHEDKIHGMGALEAMVQPPPDQKHDDIGTDGMMISESTAQWSQD